MFQIVFRKGHSQNCEYLNCKCAQCMAIKMRNDSMARCMSNERKSTLASKNSNPAFPHAETNYRIGHKGSCPYEHCLCDLCSATQMRNKSMAQTMANERKLTALKRQQSASLVADSSCSSTTPVMCSSLIKPEYHEHYEDQLAPDTTTNYERPVKRLRTSPPTSETLGAPIGYGYPGPLQDARSPWVGYDCLRHGMDPRYNIYPVYTGMAPFPSAQPAATVATHHVMEDRKRQLLDSASYKCMTGGLRTATSIHPGSASYQVNALLRDSSSALATSVTPTTPTDMMVHHKESDRDRDREIEGQRDSETERQRDRETERQRDINRNRNRDRDRDRDRD
eukprot:sb/3466511/